MDAAGKGHTSDKTGFDRIASRYERWYDKPANRLIDTLEKRSLRDLLPPGHAGALLLDVGVGTGHWVSLPREAGYTVVGLDKSASMLEIASSRSDFEGLLTQGDAHRLPFPDARFDVVFSVTTLEFVRQPQKALEEMLRCLRPGGSLVLGLLNASSFLGLKRKMFRSSTFREAHFFTLREVRRMLTTTGRVRATTCAFMPPWGWLTPAGEGLEKIGKALTPWLGQLIVARVDKPGSEGNGAG